MFQDPDVLPMQALLMKQHSLQQLKKVLFRIEEQHWAKQKHKNVQTITMLSIHTLCQNSMLRCSFQCWGINKVSAFSYCLKVPTTALSLKQPDISFLSSESLLPSPAITECLRESAASRTCPSHKYCNLTAPITLKMTSLDEGLLCTP